MRASHILITYDSARYRVDGLLAPARVVRSKDEAQTTIDELRTAVAAGADFAKLAQLHSDCPTSDDGGDLGQLTPGQLEATFEQAAFALPAMGLSAVIETKFGFHLILRTS